MPNDAAVPQQSATPRTQPDPGHARFGPSSAHRWLACPASIPLGEAHVAQYGREPAGPAAQAGTECHAVAEYILRRGGTPLTMGISAQRWGEIEPLVWPYVERVRAICAEAEMLHGSFTLMIERTLSTGVRDCWGTLDAAVVAGNEAWIVDLKTGGERVLAEENPQLLTYAVAIKRMCRGIEHFHLEISQPRDTEMPLKQWTCDARRVDRHRGEIRAAVRAATGPGTLRPEVGEHCRYCPAAGTCPERNRQAVAVFDTLPPLVAPLAGQIALMSPEQRAFVQENAQRMRSFLDAVEEVNTQHPPPGWKLVEGRTRRQWVDPVRAIMVLRNYGVDSRLSPPAIGVAESRLRLAYPQEEVDAILSAIVETPRGAPRLVPESDPRPALDPGAVFALPSDPQPL